MADNGVSETMSGAETVLKVIEKIFLSPRVSVTVSLVCVTALLVGPHVAAYAPLIQEHRVWLWGFLLISGFYSATFPVQWVWEMGKTAVTSRHAKRRIVARLQSLTVREKHILQEHLEDKCRVVSWSVNRLEIASLVHDGVIGLIQQHGSDLPPAFVHVRIRQICSAPSPV
jgi:Super-infection exclusion protein B